MPNRWILTLLFAFGLAETAAAMPLNAVNTAPGATRPTFVPSGGYVRTAKALRFRRKAAANVPGSTIAPAQAVLQGERNVPVILVGFNNRTPDFNRDAYQQLLFDEPGAPVRPTFTQYYKDVSHGRLVVRGTVVDWLNLPNADSYYENGAHGGGKPFGDYLRLGLENADTTLDFGQFDNDGLDGVPNSGDDDGKVDAVFFIHPERGAECRGLAANNIWSHSWYFSEPTYGQGGPFVTKDVRRDANGSPMLKADGTPEHITIDDYTIQPGLSCKSTQTTARIVEIGVFAHEYGHALGLPDLYDRTPNGNPDSHGIGNWGLMAGGSYGGDGKHPEMPSHMSAWSKSFLGWTTVEPISFSKHVVFEPVEDRGRVYRIDVPGTFRKEYFLLEYRDKTWRDTVYGARINWDQHLYGSGLAIWHVDENVGAGPDWPFAPHDQGQNDSPSIPNAAKHALVALEQADGRQDLENKVGQRGDGNDLWTVNSSFADDPGEKAGSRSYAGNQTQISISFLNAARKTVVVEVPRGFAASGGAPGAANIAGPMAPSMSMSEFQSLESSPALAGSTMFSTVLDVSRMVSASASSPHAWSEPRIEAMVPLSAQSSVRTKVAQAMTKTAAEITNASSAAEKRLKVWFDTSAGDSMPVYRTGPDGKTIAEVRNLDVALVKPTVKEDAESRAKKKLPELLGKGVKFVEKKLPDIKWLKWRGEAAQEEAPVFQQQVKVQGHELPVFETDTHLYYQQGKFKGYHSKAVDPKQIKVSGGDAELAPDQAVQLVQEQLGMGAHQSDQIGLCSPDKGVYLVGKDPAKGRVSYEICVSAGAKRKPIRVYFDAKTRTILDIL